MTQLWRAFSYVIPIFLLLAPFLLIAGFLTYLKRKKRILKNEAILTVVVDMLLTFSVIGVLFITVFSTGSGNVKTVQLIPFSDITNLLFRSVNVSVPLRNIGLNILLFVPFGIFVSWRLTSKKTIKAALILGFIFSTTIEVLQFLLPLGRSTSIDDVILNSLGTFFGTLLYINIAKLFPHKLTKVPFINLKTSSKATIIE